MYVCVTLVYCYTISTVSVYVYVYIYIWYLILVWLRCDAPCFALAAALGPAPRATVSRCRSRPRTSWTRRRHCFGTPPRPFQPLLYSLTLTLYLSPYTGVCGCVLPLTYMSLFLWLSHLRTMFIRLCSQLATHACTRIVSSVLPSGIPRHLVAAPSLAWTL